jgi:aspartate ammonia-lyase
MTLQAALIVPRTEHDFLGERAIPAGSYWGIHTARALENFAVSGIPVSRHRHLVAALGSVKQAAVRANLRLGLLDPGHARAIDQACEDVRVGLLDDQFVVDVVQGGAGTSTNMNANEVIANRALELLGLDVGSYDVISPNDHVNRSQSTNDVYPTAVKIAFLSALDELAGALGRLVHALGEKGDEFAGVLKVGRTQLQDAVPMTVGQEFRAWSLTMAEEQDRILDARGLLREVNLGATAIGTGITTRPGYAAYVVEELVALTGLPLVAAENLIEATSDTGSFVQLSGMLKRSAVKVSKICNDLRLLSSGPQAGFGELRLPPRQAGSSIMPGKVNPVIPELVNQVAFAIVGNDVTVTMAAEAGQLQLNAFEPIIAHTLLQGIGWLGNALDSLTVHCIRGIEVDSEHLAATSARSIGVVTALTPVIGYAAAARIARASLAGGGEIREMVLAEGLVPADQLTALLRPESMTRVPGPPVTTGETAGAPSGAS